jgi:thiosulfate dehydrogenase
MSARVRTTGVMAALGIAALVVVACSQQLHSQPGAEPSTANVGAAADVEAAIPSGPKGELIAYGRDLITQTPKFAGSYITARMSCAACHPRAGTQAHAGSLVGTYAMFPQWNRRSHRFIALQDRLAECFLYSMNGHPPAYYSREMIAITAYIAWLSRGAPTGTGFTDQEPLAVHAPNPPDAHRGKTIYTAKCLSCHGADGNGVGLTYPPLWGPQSFNDKAGMSRMDRIVPFVKVAMPQNSPGSLTDQQAADVAAFILSQPRPHFDRNRKIEFPSVPAGYF